MENIKLNGSTAIRDMLSLEKKVNECVDWINNQEKLIPTQTPNSDSNQRSLQKLNLIKNQLDVKWYGTAKNTLEDLIIKLAKEVANGETPEEDNTVGQVSILFTQEEINKLKQILDTKYSKDWEFKMNMILKLSTNKPVETRSDKTLNIGETLEADNTEGQDQMISEVRNYLTNNDITWGTINNVEDIIRGNFNRMKK